MSSLFDGIADVFAETFGEEIVYTPAATGVARRITAIWIEDPLDPVIGGGVAVDDVMPTLHVRASDIPAPREGDLAQRVKTGETLEIVPPIRPDRKGMIACSLANYLPASDVGDDDLYAGWMAAA